MEANWSDEEPVERVVTRRERDGDYSHTNMEAGDTVRIPHSLSEELNNTNEQISPVEELAQNDVQKVPEIRLQEDDVTNECDPKDQQDKNTVTTDLPKTSPRDRRSVSPLSFLREDFSHFKEELLKVFRDKDTDQSSEAARMHDPLKVDLAFKVDVASVFKSTDPKSSQSAKKTNNRLSFLNFKDHVSNAFRLGPSKVPDSSAAFKIKASSMEPDSSNAFKIKASSKERDNEGVTAEEDSSNAFKIKASSMEPDSSNAFKIKASSKERDNEGVTAEEDSSNAFKIKASSKERDNEGVTAKEDSSNAFKIKASSKERDNEGVTAKEDSSNAFKIKASSKEPDSSIAFKIKASSMERDNEGVTAKEDSSNAFKIKAFSKERDNKGVTAKEDSSNAFKIKVSSDVFTLNPSKERDNKGVTAEEDSSNAFKIKAERTDGPFLLSLFRKTSQKVESGAEDKKIISETSEQTKEEIDASFKGNVLKQNEETVDAEKINDNLKDGMKEMEVAETTSVSETQHEETINRLSFLNFKDVSNVFRLGPSKERDSSNAFKIKASSKERDHKGVTAEEVSSNAFKIKASSKERDHKGVTAEEVSSNAFKIKASSKERDHKGVTAEEVSSNAFKIKASSKERDHKGVTAEEVSSNAFKIKASSKERDHKGVTAEEVSSNAFKIKASSMEPDSSNAFKIKASSKERDNEGVTAKEDLSNAFKIKASSDVFTLNPSKERDNKGVTAEEDSSNAFKIKAERTDGPFLLSLFRKTSQKVESGAEDKKIISETSEQTKEEIDASFKGNVLKQNEETVDAEKINDNLKDGMKEMEVAETTSVSETQHEETINRLSFLNFKDVSNVFRLGPSKERDHKGVTAKEDSSNTFKIKAERTEEPFVLSLFRKTPQKVESSAENESIISEISQFAGFKGNVSEQNEETVDAEKINDNLKDGMNEVEVNEITSLSETQHREEMIPTSQAAEQRYESDESSETADDERMNKEEPEREEKPSETLPPQLLSSEIKFFRLRDSNIDDMRGRPGGNSWSVKNFACYLTFDPNTANSELRLSDSNRTVTRAWTELWPPEHPDRFQRCPQVLCREGLLDSAYWEAEWSGGADIGIAYNDIYRDGDAARCLLGHNERSWSLECSEGSYTPCHANRRFRAAAPRPFARRVGVHLDWSAGALSFYCVSQDAMVHLHTFRDNFTEPLYPAFWVWAYDGSVSLSQVELDWERLLQ